MTKFKLLLLILASCTFMFIGWIILGCYYWVQNQRNIALMCCLLAFVSALGQFAALAFTLRERAAQQIYRALSSKDVKHE